MNTTELAVIFLPAGVMLLAAAALWQVYVVLSESYTLTRFKDRQLLLPALAMFFSFSLAVYWLCPNSRRKGRWFLLAGLSGTLLYGLGMWWLRPYLPR